MESTCEWCRYEGFVYWCDPAYYGSHLDAENDEPLLLCWECSSQWHGDRDPDRDDLRA